MGGRIERIGNGLGVVGKIRLRIGVIPGHEGFIAGARRGPGWIVRAIIGGGVTKKVQRHISIARADSGNAAKDFRYLMLKSANRIEGAGGDAPPVQV